ncbi:hypothetical protein CY658_20485 [Variovorax sp. RO1]|nr:hypothetical protein CY658_20485 [Variovorax sp. RO1]
MPLPRVPCPWRSPKLLESIATPQVPADLALLPSLGLGVPQGEHVWALFGPDGSQVAVHHQPRLITRGMLALRAAATAGLGVVQLPTMMVREHFVRGELAQVLPGWAPRREIVHAVFSSRRGQLPSVRALIDFLVASFAALDED